MTLRYVKWLFLSSSFFVVNLSVSCSGADGGKIVSEIIEELDASLADVKSDLCTSNCLGKECGDDNCGGVCGVCSTDNQVCAEDGTCEKIPCSSSKDCPGAFVCAKGPGHCVECVEDEDCPEDHHCDTNYECQPSTPCNSDVDCKETGLVCAKQVGYCVECVASDDCDEVSNCQDYECVSDLCDASEKKCDGDEVQQCIEDGSAWQVITHCAESMFCDEGECIGYPCKAGQVWCEGATYKVCSDDGKSISLAQDCSKEEKQCGPSGCFVGCTPAEKGCLDSQTWQVCNSEGTGHDVFECPEEQFCTDGECLPWKCTPGDGQCVGQMATICDPSGSGPVLPGVDCAALEQLCQEGVCVSCQPDCTNKECGGDGCWGECGECASGQVCIEGQCPPPGQQCDDGNDTMWDGCTSGELTEFVLYVDPVADISYIETLPRVANVGNGRHVIVYRTKSELDGMGDIVAQFYDNGSEPLLEQQSTVNSPVEGEQREADVACSDSGTTFVVWRGADGSGSGIVAQLYNQAGEKIGGNFQVNSEKEGSQEAPRVVSDGEGFIVGWQSMKQDGDSWGIYVQRFSANGEALLVSEMQANGFPNGAQSHCSLATNSMGSTLVLWQSGAHFDGDSWGVGAQLFDMSLNKQGSEFIVNSIIEGDQEQPAGALSDEGIFLATWTSHLLWEWSKPDIHTNLRDEDGEMLGVEFVVNSHKSGTQAMSNVLALPWGFVVVWQSNELASDEQMGGRFQRLGPNGEKIGAETQVNEMTIGLQARFAMAEDVDGGWIAVWQSKDPDTSKYSVFARRFSSDAEPLFR